MQTLKDIIMLFQMVAVVTHRILFNFNRIVK